MNETTRKQQAKELTSLLAAECRDMTDVQSLLKDLFKDTVESMLEGRKGHQQMYVHRAGHQHGRTERNPWHVAFR